MDLEEWELLSNNILEDLDLLDHHEPMVLDYFTNIQDPLHKTESPPRSIVPIAWEPVTDHETKNIPNYSTNVFLKETEFADMKIDLEKGSDSEGEEDDLREKKEDDAKMNLWENKNITNDSDLDSDSIRVSLKETEFADMKLDLERGSDSEGGGDDLREKKDDDDCEKMNLWKIGVNGIGTICSFGVAAVAATVCVFFLGHNNIKICKNKNQMLRFQFYSDDNKRMKEVMNKATKLNETIFAMKGVPVVRAQISFGGHYDGL